MDKIAIKQIIWNDDYFKKKGQDLMKSCDRIA
jgi:hypothetical protein